MKKAALAIRLFVSSICLLTLNAASAQEEIEMQGPTSLSETYDAWTVQCVNQQQGEVTRRVCQMSQTLLQKESQQRVLTFALRRSEDRAVATLVLPFGLLLSEGFRIQMADEEILRGAFRTCLPAGCIAEVEIPAGTISKLEAAETANVLMTATSGQQVKADISLMGFRAAYQRLVALAAR
jgi:Invasion protein B, involved in pathogenesis